MSTAGFIAQFIPETGLWAQTVLANTVGEWFAAAIVFVVFALIFRIVLGSVAGYLGRFVRKTQTSVDDSLIAAIHAIRPSFYLFAAFYLGLASLALSQLLSRALFVIFIIWAVWQAIMVLQVMVDTLVQRGLLQHEDDSARHAAFLTMRKLFKVGLWLVGGLFILSNLGINITSLVAGLGIGGVAVALALQNILTDLFSSFALYFDKPFEPGDFIVVGEHEGTVERIGIKTTRLRALQGEEIVISNRELTDARVQNFKKLEERRVTFSFGVEYDTPHEKLEKIPGIVKQAVQDVEQTHFDRATLEELGEAALVYEAVYYVESSDYNIYKARNEAVLLRLSKSLKEQAIALAYPTRAIIIKKHNA